MDDYYMLHIWLGAKHGDVFGNRIYNNGDTGIFVRGWWEEYDWLDEIPPGTGFLLINEMSDHLPIYVWGRAARGALMLAGKNLASAERILPTAQGMLSLRDAVEKVLKSLGVAPMQLEAEPAIPEPEPLSLDPQEPEPEVDLDALFASANQNSTVKDIDAFWDSAVEKTSNVPTNPDVISFDEARKLGLTPGKTMPVRLTGPLKPDEPPKPPK